MGDGLEVGRAIGKAAWGSGERGKLVRCAHTGKNAVDQRVRTRRLPFGFELGQSILLLVSI
jgi:hypothetical protein